MLTGNQYPDSHRIPVDSLQQIADDVDQRLLPLVFEFPGYSAVECDEERYYALPNASDLLRGIICASDEGNKCRQRNRRALRVNSESGNGVK